MLVFHAFVIRLPTRFRPCLSPTCLLCLIPDPACPWTIVPCLLSEPACTYVDRLACSLTLCPALTHLLSAVLWFVCLYIIRYSSALVLLPIKYITNTPWFLECCIWVLHKIVTLTVRKRGQSPKSTNGFQRNGKNAHFHPNHLRGGVFFAKPL